MKKSLAVLAALALLGASTQHARAGDREWATAGKILTGVAAVGLITRALEPAPVYYDAPVRYVPAREVIYVPAPRRTVVVRHAPVVVHRRAVRRTVVYAAPPPVVYVSAPHAGFHLGFGHAHSVPVYPVCR